MYCHVCQTGLINEHTEYTALCRSASDCSPWPSGGRIGVCEACGVVQKILDQKWQQEVSAIYEKYDIYHQSPQHREQPIYFATEDRWLPRSEAVLAFFLNNSVTDISANCKILDIGCGNGATLAALAKIFPKHPRYGFDPTATNIATLKERNDLAVTDCSRDVNDLRQKYGLLTMIHVLEHIPSPLPILKEYVQMLDDDGHFIIVVPNFLENPFDITITDHCSHFSLETLRNLLINVGLKIDISTSTAIPKELVMICSKTLVRQTNTMQDIGLSISENAVMLDAQINWLKAICDQVDKITHSGGNFGILGTSIAGNWLFGYASKNVRFFVDEDPDRVGTIYRGVPVLNFAQLQENDVVYVALPPLIAEKVKKRHNHLSCHVYVTPSLNLEPLTSERV